MAHVKERGIKLLILKGYLIDRIKAAPVQSVTRCVGVADGGGISCLGAVLYIGSRTMTGR